MTWSPTRTNRGGDEVLATALTSCSTYWSWNLGVAATPFFVLYTATPPTSWPPTRRVRTAGDASRPPAGAASGPREWRSAGAKTEVSAEEAGPYPTAVSVGGEIRGMALRGSPVVGRRPAALAAADALPLPPEDPAEECAD